MRNDANSLGSTIDLQWSETFNRKVVKKSFEMFNYRVADDRSDCLCGKVFETRFDSEGSTSRLVPSAVQTFRIMSWKYSLRSLHENSPYRCLNFRRLAPLFPYLMVISTITFGFCERSSWRGRKYHHWRRFICLFNRNVSSPWNRYKIDLIVLAKVLFEYLIRIIW